MPFDTTYKPKTVEPDIDDLCKRDEVLRVLVEADRFLDSEDRWCKFAQHDGDGRHCAVGAVGYSQGRNGARSSDPPIVALSQALPSGFQPTTFPDGSIHGWNVADFNNAEATTFADVKALFARAISERARFLRKEG